MANSLRSKPKLRAKSVKRKGEFTKFVDDRNARLAEKTRLNLQKQNEEKMAEDTPIEEASEDAASKISNTSGRSAAARKKMKVKKSRNKKLKF
ncbi:hypothetical protein METBIDRAFT_33687 [Metschnikowia bicuspidata var. bicuspidata NRRL YB-4993]|uniref:DUF2423 domain-containing protein n=1 Tax=Metschnikowia bicuspidata var. bicuspidata NRRL YB-4993 TaxID=869754 RepID=A0A1A0H580_9ASCO|nr:hypothetical protein METBIDRAFT_33687 [Metschnikowia bicuspidata var. bicuspidata NRRL YB-4993]OBA19078.1 hypothetical protein METBIDRAFT_33687 [Metschnikowia bicuspidata var. bicuspidata NRRL YB-4993]